MPRQLLALSVWADLRDDGLRARLLLAVAPRLGLTRVVVATAGPLTAADELVESLIDSAPDGVDILLRNPMVRRSTAGPEGRPWVPMWPDRDIERLLVHEGSGGVTLDVSVSIGRTHAEASARASSDDVFQIIGAPEQQGIFGRLEDAQDQVARLAAAGVVELCCILPRPDLLDHLAQLTAVAVGHLATHAPGIGRSPDPAPPAGWGGLGPLSA